MTVTKAIVLSSGGVDSTTCLAMAVAEVGATNVTSLSMYYGQRHHKELEAARAIAEHYGVNHIELNLTPVFAYSDCPLLQHSTEEIPEGDYAEQIDRSDNGMVSTYVPFRNGMFLSAAASVASSIYPDAPVAIYIGAHADDAAGNAYADCSEEFIDALDDAIYAGTYNKVTIKAPFVCMSKADVVRKGLELGAPYRLTWSCYAGGDRPCGKCGTCIDRAKAFEANRFVDPALEG